MNTAKPQVLLIRDLIGGMCLKMVSAVEGSSPVVLVSDSAVNGEIAEDLMIGRLARVDSRTR